MLDWPTTLYEVFSWVAFPYSTIVPTNQLPCPFLRLIWKKCSRCEGKQDTGNVCSMSTVNRARAANKRVGST
ncbi:hypothetical protein BDR05DRAFT_27113 [Suillus weaverae]|nr:hypothetical protein BDR05DRAFT_27113 [Suillus weaverae]